MSNSNTSTSDEKQKVQILKQAVLEERKKSQALKDEITLLKDTISDKDEQIAKLQHDFNNLSEALSKQDPKAYYDNLFKAQETNQAEFNELKADSNKMKYQIETLFKDNSTEKTKNEELRQSYQKYKEESTETIERLTNQLDQERSNSVEDQGKLKVMFDNFKVYDIRLTSYEEQIDSLTKENKRLMNDNDTYGIQVYTYEKLLAHMKEENEKLNVVNDLLKRKIEKSTISNDYIFKGKLLENNNKKYELELTYGKYEDSLVIQIKGEKEKIISMNDIIDVKKEKWGIVVITYKTYTNSTSNSSNSRNSNSSNNANKKELRCEFDDDQIEYIIKYGEELKAKCEVRENQFLSMQWSAFH